jgi:hypothetical protein
MEKLARSLPLSTEPTPAERARKILNALILERRDLRSSGADQATLEANRLALAYWQRQLSRLSGAAATARIVSSGDVPEG